MPDDLATDPAKTSSRFVVVGLTSLCAVLMYLDRVCIGILSPYMREDLNLSKDQWSWVMSAFFLSYALAQVPAASFSDRFGPRHMLTIYVLLWSMCTAVSGVMMGFVALLVARLACGLSQAGGYPTSAALLKRWIPLRNRGLASSLVSLGGRLGGVLAPVLTALLVVQLTPADVPTRITERDLLAPHEIAATLIAPDNEQPSELTAEIHHHLPVDSHEWVERLSKSEEGEVSTRQRDADVAQLAKFLDSALSASWLTDKLSVETLGLPNEAIAILTIDRSSRSELQTAKLHRLAMEVAFPDKLRHVYTSSWRRVLWLYGVLGLFVAAAYWLFVRDRPVDSQLQAPTSRDSIQPAPEERQSPAAVLRVLVTSGNLWLVSIAQFGINVGWTFLITLLPDYLAERFPEVTLEERGRLAGIPGAVGCLGMLVGGVLTDRLARRLGLRWGRALPIGIAAFVCAGIMLACPWAPSALAVVGALDSLAAMVDLGVPSIWAFIQDIGSRNVGTALGWGNMCGNLGSAMSPLLFRTIEKSFGWKAAFAAGAASFAVAGICALCMDATRPLEPATPQTSDGQ